MPVRPPRYTLRRMGDPPSPGHAPVAAGAPPGGHAGTRSLDPSFFLDAVERSPDGFTLLESVRDASGRIADFRRAYVNPAGRRLLGRARRGPWGCGPPRS